MTKRMILMLVGVVLVFGTVFGLKWFGNKMMVQYIENMPMPPATISTAKAAEMQWDNRLEAIGTLVAVNGADVTVEAGGIVTAIEFESGEKVEKGQLLLQLDAANDRGELKRLQAQAELSELNRKRRAQLYELEAISKSDLDAAVAEANAAKAAVEAQQGKLALKEIRAPFSGTLGVRRVNVGQYVGPGTAIVSLQALNPIDLDFSLPEQYVGSVAAGYDVTVKVDAYPDRIFAGQVLAVEPTVDNATRNFKLRARLPNPDAALKPGQFGRVVLSLPGERDVMVVPRTAINYNSYGSSVFVVQPRQQSEGAAEGEASLEVVQRFIKEGDARGDFVAIVTGLEAGDEVATSGLLKLRNQQPVIINNDVQPKAELDPQPEQG